MLIHQPVPGGLLSGIIAGAKALLIDLMKQCRNQVVLHPLKFCRLCMTMLLISFFYIPAWVFPGDSLFQLAIGDIIITSYHFMPMLCPFWMSHPIRGFPTWTHPHACILTIRRGYSQLHSSFQLSERKHLMLTAHQHRKYIVYFGSYIQGKCVLLACCINFTCIPTYLASLGMYAHDYCLIFFSFKDGRLDI